MVHYLHREQVIPAAADKVWAYFCEPKNLNEITPPDMNFDILHGGNTAMYEGQMTEYRVEFIRGIRSLWLTEITHVRNGEYFVDEQRVGPYRLWHHEHHFEQVENGVRMIDHVTYVPPLGWMGDLVNRLWIRGRLERIFDFRGRKISEIFGEVKWQTG
jgi:ligand-binding SRPBCC domain-containing protein